MRIGILATEVGKQTGGAYMGGNVNNVITISKELAARGHEVVIVTTTPRDAAPDPTGDIDWAKVYEHEPRFAHGSFGYFLSFTLYATQKLRSIYQREPLDLLTIHSGFPIWGLIGRIISTTTSYPVAHFQYCPIGQKSGSRVYNLLQRPWTTRRFLTDIDKLVGISPIVSESLANAMRLRDTDTIYPAIDTDRYTPVEDSEMPEKLTISYLGSLKKQKGLDLLVESFQEIREKYDCKLKLGLEARFERDESELARTVREDPDIDARGILQDVPQFLGRSHVFAVPFRSTVGPADYPVAALEAMSCGVPVIATDVGGLSRLVEQSNGGYCIGEPSKDSLIHGISYLSDNSDARESMGKNSRSFIIDNLSTGKVVDQIESLGVQSVH